MLWHPSKGIALHFFGAEKGRTCFIDYHNDACFGLGYGDAALVNTNKRDWLPPSGKKRKANAKQIASLKAILESDRINE